MSLCYPKLFSQRILVLEFKPRQSGPDSPLWSARLCCQVLHQHWGYSSEQGRLVPDLTKLSFLWVDKEQKQDIKQCKMTTKLIQVNN